MREHGWHTLVAGIALWLLALSGVALAIPDHAKGQAGAVQLPSGGEINAAVTVGESGPSSQPTGPVRETAGGTTASQNLITYHWVSTGTSCWHELGDVPEQGSPNDVIYERVRVDRTTDPPTTISLYEECLDPATAPVTPPPPPPPPTLTEMSTLATSLIIVPDVRVSPDADVGGVTGLETWFWYDGQKEVTTTAGIRGYSVTATMHPSRYYWDPGDPRSGLLESARPGSERDPAARWVYETKGDHRVRLQVVWDGTWTFTGFGASATGDLPTIRATSATDYQVDEIRSELRSTR